MNAPFTYASPTLTVDALKHSIAYKLMFTIGKDPSIANKHEWLNASLLAVRDRMVERWLRSSRAQLSQDVRQVYYLSMEFLMGRTLGNALLAMGCRAVLIKGGHLDDAESPDWLFTRDGAQRFTAPRVQTKNTHGTGCTLSAALAALRPRNANWADTVQEAKIWLSCALAKADSLEVGHGIGPVHHFHAWW